MSTRYTFDDLQKDVATINAKLEKLGHKYRLGLGSAYGDWQLLECNPEQLVRGCCQARLETGTPRECLAAANQYLVNQVK